VCSWIELGHKKVIEVCLPKRVSVFPQQFALADVGLSESDAGWADLVHDNLPVLV
jgi:hypothetical protein